MTEFSITRDDWRSLSPAVLAHRLFAPAGTVARHIPNYAYNPAQARYAEAVIATLRRADDGPARATFAEASTGVGKTLGYLVPALIEATFEASRILVSTYTLELQRQIFRDDGPIASRIVADITGRAPVIAPRRARSHFASPSRCRRLAKIETPERARALFSLADFADRALAAPAAPRNDHDLWAQVEAGLIDAWRDENQIHSEAILDLDTSAYALDSASPAEEQALWKIGADLAARAHCLIATHAATIVDLKLWGALHGAKERPFAIAILDEADQIEQAAVSALGVERSAPGMLYRLRALQGALAEAGVSPELAASIDGQIERTLVIAENLVTEMRTLAPSAGPSRIALNNDMPWLDKLEEVAIEIEPIITAGKTIENASFADELYSLVRTRADILSFLESLEESSGNTRRASRASLSFSPVSQAPSMIVDAVGGGRIMSRLWNEKAGLAQSIFVTSATLAFPGKPIATAFAYISRATGLTDEARINHDLNVLIEPDKFGNPSFVLAHPSSPSPNREDEEREIRAPSWLAASAEAIVQAAKRSRGRTLVLCTSHADAEHIALDIGDQLNGRLLVRGAQDSLRKIIAQAAANENSVVIAAGAWQGLNRPGLFQTGVIVRLPFTAQPSFPNEGDAAATPSFSMWDMMRHLRQGLGRFIRSHADAPEIWIVDPRIGLPPSMRDTMVDGKILAAHPQSQTTYLAAVPKRFSAALARAELFTPAIAAKTAPRKTKKAAR